MKASDDSSLLSSTMLDQGINPEVLKHNKGIVKSRKGGKAKNVPSSLFYQDAKKRSSSRRTDSSPEVKVMFTKDDEIKELDEEDEEEHKSIAHMSPI